MFSPGDRVILSYNYCRSCTTCEDGHLAYYEHMVALNFGGSRLDGTTTTKTMNSESLYRNFFGQSSFARLAVVNMSCLVKVPESTSPPLDILSPLGCGFQTGAGVVMNTLK